MINKCYYKSARQFDKCHAISKQKRFMVTPSTFSLTSNALVYDSQSGMYINVPDRNVIKPHIFISGGDIAIKNKIKDIQSQMQSPIPSSYVIRFQDNTHIKSLPKIVHEKVSLLIDQHHFDSYDDSNFDSSIGVMTKNDFSCESSTTDRKKVVESISFLSYHKKRGLRTKALLQLHSLEDVFDFTDMIAELVDKTNIDMIFLSTVVDTSQGSVSAVDTNIDDAVIRECIEGIISLDVTGNPLLLRLGICGCYKISELALESGVTNILYSGVDVVRKSSNSERSLLTEAELIKLAVKFQKKI